MATFVHCSLLCIKWITVAANANIIIETEKVTPSINFCGSDCFKSFNQKGEVRIERNVIMAVKANARESTSDSVKITKKGWLTRIG